MVSVACCDLRLGRGAGFADGLAIGGQGRFRFRLQLLGALDVALQALVALAQGAGDARQHQLRQEQ